MPKSSVSDIQKVPGPATLLCHKRQFYPTKMQKSIKHTKWKVSKQKITNSVGHFSFFPFFLRGGGSSQFIWDTSGGGGLLPKISYEEGGSSYTTGATLQIPKAPSPIKNKRSLIPGADSIDSPLRHV